jgi:hypothetical protein
MVLKASTTSSKYLHSSLSLPRSRIVDNGHHHAIIVDIMENQAELRISELWRLWKPRSITLTTAQTTALGISKRAHVYAWLYELGIQPDRYIVRKASYGGHIEIRFGYSEDLGFIRMSGIIPD